MFQCHTFMTNIRHQNQTFGIPSGLDTSHITKRKLAGFQAHALFHWFNPEGFLRKSRQTTGQRHQKRARTNASGKTTLHRCCQRKGGCDSHPSSVSLSFSLCCGNTQRITSVDLALLKPPKAAALIRLACTGHCGPGLLLARVKGRVQCRVGLVPACAMGLLSSVLVVSTEAWARWRRLK